jgi:hypothetical protein
MATPSTQGNARPAAAGVSGYNSTAWVRVTNNFSGAADITLTHQYSSDPPQSQTWNNVQAGDATGDLEVGFNLGFLRTGDDWWHVDVSVKAGPQAGHWSSDSHACMLRSADVGTHMTFAVSPAGFEMFETSGSCHTGWAEHP